MTTALQVTIPGAPALDRPDRLAIITDPVLGDVPVRWRLLPRGTWIFRCSACGPQTRADCPHTFAMAMHLADTLLGLTATATSPQTPPSRHGTASPRKASA